MWWKYIGFAILSSASGWAYLEYHKHSVTNIKVEQLIESGSIKDHLYNFNQESAFNADKVMDSYERGYNKSMIENYKQVLLNQADGKVLQTNAGTNRNIRFYKPGTDLTLNDYSPNMAMIGQTKISPSINFEYKIADTTALPFADNTFDTVVDMFGLQYVVNPHAALKQMRRVCRKNGKLILMNEGLSEILEFHYFQNFKWGQKLLHGGYFSNRNWDKLLKQFDFKIVHHQRKKNGKIYIYILKNEKNGTVNDENPKQNINLS